MKSVYWPVMILWLLIAFPATAEDLSSRDFGYGYMIDVGSSGAIYSLPVPGQVYRTVRRADLGDIRIFNGAGEAVPHMLRDLAAPEETTRSRREIPFFPLHEQGGKTAGTMSLSVHRNADGTIIDIDSGTMASSEEHQPTGYLLDLGNRPIDISTLQLNWQADPSHATNSVMVQQSNDLQHWRTIVAKTTLADLEYGGNRVEQRKIELPPGLERYLKITWLQPRSPVALQQVSALSRPLVSKQNIQWTSLRNGLKHQLEEKTTIEYNSQYRLPVRSVRLQFPEQNSIVSALVQSRTGDGEKWQERCRHVFYTLEVNGERLQNEPCAFSPTSAKQWRLVVLDDGSGLGGRSNPVIDLGWQSGELLFLARGPGPFILAYGSGKLENVRIEHNGHIALSAVTRQQTTNIVHAAILGKHIELGGERALVPPPPPKPWKTWLLWGVLLAGVAGMAVMASKLMRDLRQQ